LSSVYTIGYEGSSPFKVTSWTDPASNQTTFAYASASSPYDKKTTVTDAEGIAIEYYFGASSGQVEKIQQHSGTDTLKIEMAYDGTTGFQTSSKDSYGYTTTKMGDCFANGASRVDCYPIRCSDGTCGIQCSGKFGDEHGELFDLCE
jgi:hypothetical protein